jgi:parvulin-like peptidyl-prolyl isomerase
MRWRRALPAATLLVLAAGSHASRAETLEEIVAWVNGDIITKSEYDEEQQARLAEAYRRFSGDELDRFVAQMHEGLLLEMIDRKILVDHAAALGYDLEKLGDTFYESFRKQQEVESEEELERLLAAEGMTVADLKRRLVETYAPDEVIRFEVRSRISVGDAEVERYYAEHPAEFDVPGKVTFREIVLLAKTDEEKRERRDEALDIVRRAAAGEDFEQLARTMSEAGTKENGGLLGPLKREDLSPALAEVAFSIREGQPSDPLETPYGFHIIRLESRSEQRRQSLDEVREKLRGFLEERKFQAELRAFFEKARQKSEWCVKPKFHHLLSVSAPSECDKL